jgi:hypothetical protein
MIATEEHSTDGDNGAGAPFKVDTRTKDHGESIHV